MKEEHLAFISSIHFAVSFAMINDVLQTIALCVAIVSGVLAIRKHYKK